MRDTFIGNFFFHAFSKSFMLSTAGFTCVAFVAGALSWWGPKFIEQGVVLQGSPDEVSG